MRRMPFRSKVLLVVMIALGIRVAAALYLGNDVSGLSGAQDEISYSMLGQRFAAGYGLTFPQHWYPWIEPNAPQSYYSATMSLYLAAIYSVFGYQPVIARLITGVLSTLLVATVMLLARRLFDENTAVISGLITAGYAYLVFYGVTLVTETPFMLCAVSAIYLAYAVADAPVLWRWVVLGTVLSIAVLFRMSVIFFVPILLAWVVLRQSGRRAMALIPVALVVLAVLPFTIRNYHLWGRFLLLESQFGHVFWNGNHPGHLGDFHPSKVFPIPPDVLTSRNDAEITGRLLQMGIQNVLKDPLSFLSLTVTRLREFFKFWPTAESTTLANLMRVASFGVVLPFAMAGIVLNINRWRELLPVFLFLVVHTSVYAISWTMIRYRVPLDPILIVFAAAAIVRAWRSWQGCRGGHGVVRGAERAAIVERDIAVRHIR
jgi:4-amino-4-deoxy-L-arabinose transferase-like glycosyltransferase